MQFRIIIGFFCWMSAASTGRCEILHVFGGGPAAEPDRFPDWGGTKDLTSDAEVGLTEEELSALVARLADEDRETRAAALAEILQNAAGAEQVFRALLFDGRGLRNTEMKSALRDAASKGEESSGALLKALVAADPSGEAGNGVRGALRMLALLEALSRIDTMAGYKVMIEFSPRHAGVFRSIIGKMLVSHGMNIMPALVYGRGSKDREIHMFSVKWIRDLGDPLLSEQVKIENPRRLAQLLEAYASVNDLDTIDVILAFTNHSSAFVRAAARGSIAAFGRNAFWPARRQYEITFGEEPPSEMDVDGVLTALYKHYDSRRLAPSRERFAEGMTAFSKGKLEEMATAFHEVLRQAPMFPRRGEMAEGFAALADAYDDDEAEKKEAALMMVLRVSEDDASAVRRRAEARLLWLRAKPLREAGLAAPEFYHRILTLDPAFEPAEEMLQRLRPDAPSRGHLIGKAFLVSLIIFLGGLLLILRLRRVRQA